MTVNSGALARRVCELGEWQVTNLALQKIMYLLHMIYMGRNDGEPLVREEFEAWDYGPVLPSVYRQARIFGGSPIRDVFLGVKDLADTQYDALIKEGCGYLLPKRPGELVAITHAKGGAWAKNYRPGVLGKRIPNSDILDEYRRRTRDRP